MIKKYKVIVANNAFSPKGGAEVIAYKTFKLLQKNGHDVYFWAYDEKPFFEDDYEYADYFTKYNGGIKNYIKNPIRYYYDYKAKQDFQKFINFVKPDLVHFHNVPSSLYSCTKDIPSILTIHGTNMFCPAVSLLLKNKTICKNHLCKKEYFLPCILNKCANNSLEASIRRALLFYINNKQLKYIDKFITPSNALMELDKSINEELFKNKIVTINNFLDNDALNTAQNYSDKNYFLYVGRLSQEKGVIYLLKAITELPNDIEFRIAGLGPQENDLKEYAQKNNLHNVKFVGQLDMNGLKDEYRDCISVILPSNCFESFGMVNIEAAINGKPAIASDIGGIPDVVENNKTGLLFEPANVEQLKECILKYWNNRKLATEHGKNAFEKLVMHYTEEIYYNKLINLYEETINEKQ